MARSKVSIPQRSFAYGELRPEFLEGDDLDFRQQSLQGAENARILATRIATSRPGLFFARTLDTTTKEVFEFEPVSDQRFAIVIQDALLLVLDENASEVVRFTGVPWSASTDVWHVDMGSYILFGPAGLYALEYSDGTWTFGEFSFRQRISGEVATPFWAFEKSVEIQPSDVTGNVTITADTGVFTSDMVGGYIRYARQQIEVTEYTSSTIIKGDVVNELPPTYKVPVGNISGFREGEIIVSSEKDWNGQVIAIEADGTLSGDNPGYLTCVTLEVFEGPDHGSEPETVSGTSASSALVADPVKVSPGATNIWDEQLISARRGYPRSAANVRGRLVFVDFPEVPDLVAISSTREPSDFDAGSEDDDAIVRQAGDSAPRFLHAVNASDLVLLSDSGCYYVKTRDGQTLTPSNFYAVRFDQSGASTVRPALVDDGIVFVERSGNKLAAAVLDGNVYLEWSIVPISQYHDHLLNSPVKVSGPAQTAEFSEKYLFVVNSDGTLAVVSWSAEFGREAIGFVPWTTDGSFVDVAPVLGRYYALVDREINGSTVRFMERFSVDAMMDCAVESSAALQISALTTEDGTAITTEDDTEITATTPATSHLGGKDVGVWWDDNYGGLVTLAADGSATDEPDGFSERQLGLPFTTTLQPWPVEYVESPRVGMMRARVSRLAVSVKDTVSFKVRRNGITTRIGAYDFGDDLSAPPSRKTKVYRFPVLGNKDHPVMEVFRDEPGPFTVLSLAQEVQV